jgi:hypothetical protein
VSKDISAINEIYKELEAAKGRVNLEFDRILDILAHYSSQKESEILQEEKGE